MYTLSVLHMYTIMVEQWIPCTAYDWTCLEHTAHEWLNDVRLEHTAHEWLNDVMCAMHCTRLDLPRAAYLFGGRGGKGGRGGGVGWCPLSWSAHRSWLDRERLATRCSFNCMCTCVHACVCTCVHACVCTRVHVYMCTCVCASTHNDWNSDLCACVVLHVCVCVYVCMCVCVCVCVCVCIIVYFWAHVFTQAKKVTHKYLLPLPALWEWAAQPQNT